MTNFAFAAFDWFCGKVGVGRWHNNRAKIWALNKSWDYSQANDASVWDDEVEKDRISEASTLFQSDPEAGFKLYLELAERGSVYCMGKVGFFYFRGQGVDADAARAEEWYRRAFEGGSTRDLLNYGGLLSARGDFEGAELAFSRAAADEWGPALFWQAWYRLKRSNTPETLRQVRPLLERAAAQGSPAAEFKLAREMAKGHFGLGEVPRGQRMLYEFAKKTFDKINEDENSGAGSAPRRRVMGNK